MSRNGVVANSCLLNATLVESGETELIVADGEGKVIYFRDRRTDF